jgi:hypothetical protein
MRSSIERGGSFSDAVALVFPPTGRWCARPSSPVGSTRNSSSHVLDRDIAAKRQIRGALTYPIIVLCMAVAAISSCRCSSCLFATMPGPRRQAAAAGALLEQHRPSPRRGR